MICIIKGGLNREINFRAFEFIFEDRVLECIEYSVEFSDTHKSDVVHYNIYALGLIGDNDHANCLHSNWNQEINTGDDIWDPSLVKFVFLLIKEPNLF